MEYFLMYWVCLFLTRGDPALNNAALFVGRWLDGIRETLVIFPQKSRRTPEPFLNSGQGTVRKKKKEKKTRLAVVFQQIWPCGRFHLLNSWPPGGTPQGGVLSPPTVQNPSNNKR